MLSLSELVSEIENIQTEKPELNFDFDDWSQELNDIQYQNLCQKIVCQNFCEWVNRDRYITFPRKEKKWKNTVVSEKRSEILIIPKETLIKKIFSSKEFTALTLDLLKMAN